MMLRPPTPLEVLLLIVLVALLIAMISGGMKP
jgi:hypothetical protein